MSWIGYSWLLLHNLGIPKPAWPNLLLPLNGSLPNDDQSYFRLLHLVRQNEHYRHGWKKDGMQSFAMEEDPSYGASAPDEVHSNYGWGPAPFSYGTEQDDLEQYADEADSESSCSECSWNSYPEDLDWDDENAVLNEVYFRFKKARRQWRNVRGRFPRNRFGKARKPSISRKPFSEESQQQ